MLDNVTLYIAINLVAIAASVFTGVYAWRRRRVPGAGAFPLISLGVATWSLGHILVLLSAGSPTQWFWANIESLGAAILPAAWLAFVLEYTRGQTSLSPRTWALLAIGPLISQAALWGSSLLYAFTNPFPIINPSVPLPVLPSGTSLLFWMNLAVSYGMYLLGIFLLLQSLIHTPRLFAGQVWALLIGVLIPGMINLAEAAGLQLIPNLDLTPLAFTLGQLAFGVGILRYRLFDLVPVARESLVEKLVDGLIILDYKHRIVDLNSAAQRITGHTVDQALGQPVTQVFIECAEVLEEALEETSGKPLEASEPPPLEICLHSNQEISGQRSYELRISALLDRKGIITGHLLILHDITRRQQAEEGRQMLAEELKEQVRLMDTILSTTPEHFHLHDREGRYLYASPPALKSVGMQASQVLGKTWRELNFPEQAGLSFDARLATIFATGETITTEVDFPAVDGIHTFEQILSPMCDVQGQILAVVSTVRDITERKQFEQDLKKSLGLLKATLESTAAGIIVIGLDGEVIIYNRKAEMFPGTPQGWLQIPSREERTRLMVDLTKEPERFVAWLKQVNQKLESSAVETFELKDGSVIEVFISPFYVGEAYAGRVWNLRDVTERKRAEEALEGANEQLMVSLFELGEYNREVTLLSEMGNLLLSCDTLEEAYAGIAGYARLLFPSHSGGLYMLEVDAEMALSGAGLSAGEGEPALLLAPAIRWGGDPPGDCRFPPVDCQALVTHKTQVANEGQAALPCQNLCLHGKNQELPYLCVPLQAQEEILGVFHLRGVPQQAPTAWEKLAVTVAEHAALSLANLVLRERLRIQSIRDPLTGLYNRRYMEESLERELSRASRYEHPVGILMLDVDYFKQYNDAFGHAAGDRLLQTLGKLLQSELRGEDIACRYGGEEFILILPDTSANDSCALADRLWEAIRHLQVTYPKGVLSPITVSIGVASFPKDGQSTAEVLQAADQALYRAKREGRDRVVGL